MKQIKCPACKKIRDFKKISLTTTREYGYLEGEYMWFYRCEECHTIVGEE